MKENVYYVPQKSEATALIYEEIKGILNSFPTILNHRQSEIVDELKLVLKSQVIARKND